jgi:hypothetical protein
MSNILTLVGRTRSFFLIDTLPFLSFLTEDILTTRFLESKTSGLSAGSPVARVKNDILLDPS